MAARKKKKKRDQNKRRRRLKQGRPQQGLPDRATVVVSPPGHEKMSEVLLEFVELYSGQWNTEEELAKLLTVAMIAWNASFLSGSEREEFLRDMVAAVPPEARPAMRAIMDELIQRKLSHFASNKRMLLDFQITMTPSGPHVAVMSTLERG
jgi:hypothetical protein